MKNVAPYGLTSETDMPFRIEPMACSRMPKWKLRPEYSSRSKLPPFLISVLVEGARSAAPPINHGTFLATAFNTLEFDSRVATPLASAGNVGMSLSHPCGKLRFAISSHSLASSGNACAQALYLSFHSCSHLAPRSTALPMWDFASSGTRNCASGGQ